MEDHYSVNIARRIRPETERFGPYHEHMFRVTVPASNTKAEALEVYEGLCARYPEPAFNVTLSHTVVRSTAVKNSGVKGKSLERKQPA
jgi:hypothetical protein